MDLKDFKVRGTIVLDCLSASMKPTVIKRTVKVIGTPFGLMVGEFKICGVTCYSVKAEGIGETWYQVGPGFPGIPSVLR